MEISLIIALPILISFITLVLTILTSRQKAEANYVSILEGRIGDLEKRMKECEDARNGLATKNQDLVQQNTNLLRRIVEETVLKKIKQ